MDLKKILAPTFFVELEPLIPLGEGLKHVRKHGCTSTLFQYQVVFLSHWKIVYFFIFMKKLVYMFTLSFSCTSYITSSHLYMSMHMDPFHVWIWS